MMVWIVAENCVVDPCVLLNMKACPPPSASAKEEEQDHASHPQQFKMPYKGCNFILYSCTVNLFFFYGVKDHIYKKGVC